MKSKLSVVKIGGNIIGEPTELQSFLTLFTEMEGYKILVHGGGRRVTDLGKELGHVPQVIGGRRITDSRTLELAIMVYGGLVNKTVVAQLQARSCNAIGLSGADGNSITAHKRPVKDIDYGWAGDIDGINTPMLSGLLRNGLTPVFCALTHDGNGRMLNTNADTIASELAIGMSRKFETALFYCFENKGVLRDQTSPDSVIRHIDPDTYRRLMEEDIIGEGMLPKLENCFHALRHGVSRVCIGDITLLKAGSALFTTVTL